MSRYSGPTHYPIFLFLFFFMRRSWAQRKSVEKRTLIDVQSYKVDVELFPAAHQIKAKATLSFKVQDPAISQVLLDFNSDLKSAGFI